MPTALRTLSDAWRSVSMVAVCCSWEPWEKLSRATSMPDARRDSSISGLWLAGPTVQTIFARLIGSNVSGGEKEVKRAVVPEAFPCGARGWVRPADVPLVEQAAGQGGRALPLPPAGRPGGRPGGGGGGGEHLGGRREAGGVRGEGGAAGVHAGRAGGAAAGGGQGVPGGAASRWGWGPGGGGDGRLAQRRGGGGVGGEAGRVGRAGGGGVGVEDAAV